MKTNIRRHYSTQTHEGGKADPHQNPSVELERAVATCLLFENTFYEKGSAIAERIAMLCKYVPVEFISQLAIKARIDYKLRHVPLFLCVQLAKLASGRKDGLVRNTISVVVQRPDEMGELISLYWKANPNASLSGQMKKGLADCFAKFNSYQFAKWNRDAEVKLRDVMFLTHPSPQYNTMGNYPARRDLYKAIAEGTLQPADTWETALSGGADKRATFERLLEEKKLGYIALLMNLRNMEQAGVRRSLVESAILDGAHGSKALPFRFVAAAKHAPSYAQTLSDAMVAALGDAPRLSGHTLFLIDISGSMDAAISAKSELSRWQAAASLAILLREITQSCRMFTFSDNLVEIPNLRGLGLINMIDNSQDHHGTYLSGALNTLRDHHPQADRIIVITDEQSADGNGMNYTPHGYLCNVASNQPALELHGGWHRINGWSERIVDWILSEEAYELSARDGVVRGQGSER